MLRLAERYVATGEVLGPAEVAVLEGVWAPRACDAFGVGLAAALPAGAGDASAAAALAGEFAGERYGLIEADGAAGGVQVIFATDATEADHLVAALAFSHLRAAGGGGAGSVAASHAWAKEHAATVQGGLEGRGWRLGAMVAGNYPRVNVQVLPAGR